MGNLGELKKYGLKRHPRFGVGKQMGSKVWVHSNYALEILDPEILNSALSQIPKSFSYVVLRYDPKNQTLAFIDSPDFNSSPEPEVGASYCVDLTQKKNPRLTKPPRDPLIWHHKWMMVKDDYPHFDVKESQERSLWWKSKVGVNREVSNRIGRKSTWVKMFGSDLWDKLPQEYDSKNTSINSSKMPKSIKILEKKGFWRPGTKNLDIGGGRFDNVTEYLSDLGVTNYILDPFNRPAKHNQEVVKQVAGGQVDTVTLNNVLNVIKEDSIKRQVLSQAKDALKAGGHIVIMVYEGDKSGVGRCTRPGQWQENLKTREYISLVKEYFPDFEYKYGMIFGKS